MFMILCSGSLIIKPSKYQHLTDLTGSVLLEDQGMVKAEDSLNPIKREKRSPGGRWGKGGARGHGNRGGRGNEKKNGKGCN